MNTKAKKIIKIVVDVLLWIFLVFSVLMTIVAFAAQSSSKGYPKVGNKCYLSVLSESMAKPTGFYKGDLIICRVLTDEEKENLEVGDVITFYTDITPDGIDNKELNTHRIVEKTTNGGYTCYITKGDNNEVNDNYLVYIDDIEAIWTGRRIKGLGAVITFFQSSTGFLLCVILPLALLFVYEIYVLVKTVKKVKNKDKKLITAEDEEMIKQRAIEEYLAQQNKSKETEQIDNEKVDDKNVDTVQVESEKVETDKVEETEKVETEQVETKKEETDSNSGENK